MPSDFLVDLIDHKQRVGLYMQKFAEKLFEKTIGDIDPVNPDDISLIDIARMFFHQVEELDLDDQVLSITDNMKNYIYGKRNRKPAIHVSIHRVRSI